MKDERVAKKRRLPAEERKKVILDAALRTFVEFGYHGALMDTIAERAEVTKPILYRHFPSKLDLLLAILDQAEEELRSALLQPNPEEMDWMTSIRHSVHSYFDFVMRSEDTFRLIYATDLNVDRKVVERITQIRDGLIAVVADVIRSYTDASAVPAEDIDVTATMLVGMVEATVMHWMNNKDLPHDVYEKNMVRAAASILSKLPPRVPTS